jgi:hypothetical protein
MTKTPRDWGRISGTILATLLFIGAAAIIISITVAIVRFLLGI